MFVFCSCFTDYGKFNEAEFKRVMQDETLKNVDYPDEVRSAGCLPCFSFTVLFFLQHGMTSLMHCAYHGLKEPCKQLLAKGADVNNYGQKDGVSLTASCMPSM